MTATTSRRAVLAGIPAVAMIPAAALTAGVDPVYALIEEHRAAWKDFGAVIHREGAAWEGIPSARRKWHWDLRQKQPPADCTDDPRWIAYQYEFKAACERADNAIYALAGCIATTRAGMIAVLDYLDETVDGEEWLGRHYVNETEFIELAEVFRDVQREALRRGFAA